MELVELPTLGRTFSTTRRVRLGDVSPSGRLRLDAVARYLQDIANDDARDAQLPAFMSWVVRRTDLRVSAPCVFLDEATVTTWCSGAGSHWAERRYRITSPAGGLVDAATIWVAIDDATGRPVRLVEEFLGIYGEAMNARRVSARLALPAPPSDASAQSWAARFSDFDALGHVNNAIAWAIVEEVLSTRRELRAGPFEVRTEYGDGILPGANMRLVTSDVTRNNERGVDAWLTVDGKVRLAMAVRIASEASPSEVAVN